MTTASPTSLPPTPRARFDDYVTVSRQSGLTVNGDYVAEVRDRLEQLAFILERVPEVSRRIDAIGKEMGRELSVLATRQGQMGPAFVVASSTPGADPIFMKHFEEQRRLVAEVRTLTEAFYYGAARVLRITKDLLPGLGAFKATGVRDVRNHLIEHPEGKSSGITSTSFSFDDAKGAVLKPQRGPGQEDIFPDRGLYANATEFMANLTAALEAAIAKAHAGD